MKEVVPGLKAAVQEVRPLRLFSQILRVDPEDDALIGLLRRHGGPVQLHGADEHQVPGIEGVVDALHQVVHPAAEEEIDLIKVVVMQRHLLHFGVPKVEDFKISPRHDLPGIETLRPAPHPPHLVLHMQQQSIATISQKLRFVPRRGSKSFLRQLCRLKNTISRAERGLASTKRGVLRSAACDKREPLIAKPEFRNH